MDFANVRVTSIEVSVEGQAKNLLATFWQQSDADLSRGLDFTPRGPVFARFTHLQHAPFTYTIKVENSGQQQQGTVRIFLAPKFDERGLPFLFRDQKNLFIELDKFVVTCKYIKYAHVPILFILSIRYLFILHCIRSIILFIN